MLGDVLVAVTVMVYVGSLIRKISRRCSRSPKYVELVVVYRGRQGKIQRLIYNARAQLLLSSLNLSFDGVLVAIAVVVASSSLLTL